ncbi:uncharacterized protein LOC114317485 [Camellia sinensis]|uniref:uncharacterized protein LOC114317485 n=1 Tax=Camellia sinensis TaxID=4442 RepID=UPI001035772F|nr:uncharacterized protein LOC114317485 [Camellia sinensis]
MAHKKAVADDLLADILNTVSAIQHAHFVTMQAFEIKKELNCKTKEAAGLLKTINKAEAKMKTLIDQAKAAKQAQDEAEEKAGAAEAVAKATQHAHFVAMQAFEIKKELNRKTKEAVGLLKTINKAEAKMKTLIDQAKAAKQAQDEAEEKAGAAEAVAKEEEDEVSKDASPKKTTSEVSITEKSLDQTLQEIDAELKAENVAKKSFQLSSGAKSQSVADAE